MNGDYSSRSMELNCKRDINFMYLLEGKPVPDHATLARFRSIHFAPCAKRILAEMSNLLYELGEISGETIFIDGTKIEACANKYTFVWKKTITKNQVKLLIKIADLIAECEQLYGIRIVHGDTVKTKHVKRLRKKLYALKQEENIVQATIPVIAEMHPTVLPATRPTMILQSRAFPMVPIRSRTILLMSTMTKRAGQDIIKSGA